MVNAPKYVGGTTRTAITNASPFATPEHHVDCAGSPARSPAATANVTEYAQNRALLAQKRNASQAALIANGRIFNLKWLCCGRRMLTRNSSMPCGAPCDFIPCSRRCDKVLDCGHQCEYPSNSIKELYANYMQAHLSVVKFVRLPRIASNVEAQKCCQWWWITLR
jgi:hypothetical protein